MPVSFEVPDIIELNKYGWFTKWRMPGITIPASAAVSISADDTGSWLNPFTRVAPYVAGDFSLRGHRGIDKWGLIIERFNWGETSRPDKVYYEIWNYGVLVKPQEQEGFHCCGKIGFADVDNRSTHPTAVEKLVLKLWNCSSPAEDVWVEFAIWYYLFPLDNLEKIAALNADLNTVKMVESLNRVEEKLDTLAAKLDTLNERLRVPELVRR